MTLNEDTVLPTAAQSDVFFRGLAPSPLPLRPRALALSSEENNKSNDVGAISDESPVIVAFADGVSGENRQAAMNSIQLSERVANTDYDLNTDPIGWHVKYKEAMGHCGWFMAGSEYGEHRTSSQTLTMDAVVLDIITAVAGPNAQTVLALVSTVFDKLKENDPAMKLFDKNSKSGNSGSFRLMPCLESSSGVAVTYFISVHCEFSSQSGGFWFWKWSASSLKIKKMATGVNLNLEHYKGQEANIRGYLGGSSDDFFSGLRK
jgi:hypothetical protein